jgi:predicted RNase H-like HicB family nuclease
MVEKIMSTYNVSYERDASGWWVASVREIRGWAPQASLILP